MFSIYFLLCFINQHKPIQNVKDESGIAEDFAHEALLVGFREKICIKYIPTTRFAFILKSHFCFLHARQGKAIETNLMS